ncbi:MAG: methyltransferase domain-containing protein [Gammaproteobacteria bacterium]|nr:methyltransferase domain-containing protein [Gammaproteobacteria bacterium]
MKYLLLGAGNDRRKKVHCPASPAESFEGELVTLDIDEHSRPDVLHDLDVLPYPFGTEEFDEIHAYEVLEHCGAQGDWRYFFAQFSEFWRILKPGGLFVGSCPKWDSPWGWGDPGHRRMIIPETLVFLSQAEYRLQVGTTAMADYRSVWKGDFEPVAARVEEHNWAFVLRAVK